jgi:hypothetical protein
MDNQPNQPIDPLQSIEPLKTFEPAQQQPPAPTPQGAAPVVVDRDGNVNLSQLQVEERNQSRIHCQFRIRASEDTF